MRQGTTFYKLPYLKGKPHKRQFKVRRRRKREEGRQGGREEGMERHGCGLCLCACFSPQATDKKGSCMMKMAMSERTLPLRGKASLLPSLTSPQNNQSHSPIPN